LCRSVTSLVVVFIQSVWGSIIGSESAGDAIKRTLCKNGGYVLAESDAVAEVIVVFSLLWMV
jgi:hypothetical protein